MCIDLTLTVNHLKVDCVKNFETSTYLYCVVTLREIFKPKRVNLGLELEAKKTFICFDGTNSLCQQSVAASC